VAAVAKSPGRTLHAGSALFQFPNVVIPPQSH
jgi:hypothetical protein